MEVPSFAVGDFHAIVVEASKPHRSGFWRHEDGAPGLVAALHTLMRVRESMFLTSAQKPSCSNPGEKLLCVRL